MDQQYGAQTPPSLFPCKRGPDRSGEVAITNTSGRQIQPRVKGEPGIVSTQGKDTLHSGGENSSKHEMVTCPLT